jgi:WhiB family transcriptional regulator, redox-sensing transcriptional regulator
MSVIETGLNQHRVSHGAQGEWEIGDRSSILDLLAALHPEWHKKAKCRGMDPDLFFPDHFAGRSGRYPFCDDCPVISQCREQGLTERGTWGGLSERARRRLVRARNIGRAS